MRLLELSIPDCSGLLNDKGEVVLPCRYKDIYLFSPGLFIVMQQDFKVGLVNSRGQAVTSDSYTQIEPFDIRGNAIVHIGHKKGYINRQGIEIVPCQYLEVSPIGEDGTLNVKTDKGPVIRILIKR